jgi:hypothetical protein
MELAAKFNKMTSSDHRKMKARLLKIAKTGQPRPAVNTLEGFALATYSAYARVFDLRKTGSGLD